MTQPVPTVASIQARWPHDRRCAHELRGHALAGVIDPPARLRHQLADDIHRHCGHSLLRSHRLAWGWSIREAVAQVHALCRTDGRSCGLDVRQWERWEKGAGTGRYYRNLLARLFRTRADRLGLVADYTDYTEPGDAPASGGSPGPADAVRVMPHSTWPPAALPSGPPSTRWGAPGAFQWGDPIERFVMTTGEESAQYADRGGNLGALTLEQLRAGVAEQAARFATADRLALFGSVRLLRDRIFSYLDGGQPIRQRRDLYFLAAATCGMLANASNDLGFASAAMSQAQAGHVFATEAGDPALTAWLYAQQSTFCYWNSQPGKAREYARRGAALSPGGTVGVWLPAVEARACGELGDGEGTHDAVRRAAEVRAGVQPGSLDEFGGLMTMNQAKQHFYAAGAFLGIGDDAAVVTHAGSAISAYQDGPAEDCAYDNIAACQFAAAVAHVRTGDLDAAGESARAALRVGTQHRSAHVDTSARRLHAQLREPAVATSPLAVDTRDQIENFLATTPTHPHLS